MNNRKLNELLRAVEPPQRNVLYWESFPARVHAQLARPTPRKEVVTGNWRALRTWGLRFATVALIIGLFLVMKITQPARSRDRDLRVLRNCYRETAGLFSGQLKALRIEAGTFKLDLSERPDVPNSVPLFVRACNNSRCSVAVTFSGQQIELLGQKFEVLADGRGGIMLLTAQGVVSAENPRLTGLGRLEVGWLDERL
jgi:hypothetical protein